MSLADELLGVLPDEAPQALLELLSSTKVWQERRGDTSVRRVDHTVMPDITRLEAVVKSPEWLAMLLAAADALPGSAWPWIGHINRILGEWHQRQLVGDRIIHPAIDSSPTP